jgi:hypothetical protein
MFSLAESGKCFITLMFLCKVRAGEGFAIFRDTQQTSQHISSDICQMGDSFGITCPDHISRRMVG